MGLVLRELEKERRGVLHGLLALARPRLAEQSGQPPPASTTHDKARAIISIVEVAVDTSRFCWLGKGRNRPDRLVCHQNLAVLPPMSCHARLAFFTTSTW